MNGTILGNIPPTCGLSAWYFSERGCFVDCRGELIVHPTANFGFNVHIYTASHPMPGGKFDATMILKRVEVQEGAWVTSDCTLYDCVIGHHSIVSTGSVVSHQTIEPFTIVSGNPAKVVARLVNGIWTKCDA